jgi:hypothetical protein
MSNFLLNHPFAISFFLIGLATIYISDKVFVSTDKEEDRGKKVTTGFLALLVFTVSLVTGSVLIDSSIGVKAQTLSKHLNNGTASEAMIRNAIISPFDQLRASLAQNEKASPEYLKILLNDESTSVKEKARANLQIRREMEIDPYSFNQSLFGRMGVFMLIQFFIIFIIVFHSKPSYKYPIGCLILILIVSSYLYTEKEFSKRTSQVFVLSSLLDSKSLSKEETRKWINLVSASPSDASDNFLSVFARKSDKIDTDNLKLLLIKGLSPFDRSLIVSELINRKEIVIKPEPVTDVFQEDLNFQSIW